MNRSALLTAALLAVAPLVLLPAGCGTKKAPTRTKVVSSTPPDAASATPADAGRVTLHVKDMTKRLKLT